jgi:murein DD-endopeptidase MepM/ murein hydrolase activator NlpD
MARAPAARRRAALAAAIIALSLFAVPGQAAVYRAPVVQGGRVFPVARTNWYSVINFANDWHAPRMRLIDGVWLQIGMHEGTDIFAEPGTPIRAVHPGTIENVGWTFYSGWRVGIRGTDGRYWFYAHMSDYAPGVEPGAQVEAGDTIGEVGNTGYGARPGHRDEFTWHLHLGIQETDGTWSNPYFMLKRLYRAAAKGAE